MATKTATKKTATKAKAAPAKKKVETKPAEPETVFGVGDVAALIQTKTGEVVKNRDLRTLLRKMANDGRLEREIVAGNRTPWSFEGPEDPEVEAIIEAFENGELAADKKAKLDALKERKAAERAAKKAAAEAEAEEVDEEELEED